jgi:ABC-type dipeptide/oligopeptide/nickel transport system permease component
VRRRLAAPLIALYLTLALPALTWAATSTGSGHDYTLTTIFVVALGIPLVLTILTLIDIAVGKHTQKHQ